MSTSQPAALPLLLAALLAPAASASAQKEADLRTAPDPSAPGGKLLEWTSAPGKNYWYRLPKKLDRNAPPNLILMLHGTGLPYKWAFWNYPIVSGRFRPDDIVLAPEGMTPGSGDTFNFVQNKQDEEHIAGLIKTFKQSLPVGRVYLYGHSQGAFFCYWFAGEHPELVDGIVAHAGNLLGNVKHPPLAREKVAVGILHGKADAVVPVDCAHATERAYQKLGYRKVKKYIVEGLTAQSGHWPLPVQVGEMLEWLDQVSVATPEQALSVALAEIHKEQPDLEVLGDTLARIRKMKKKPSGDEAAFRQRLDLATGFLVACEAAHREALAAVGELGDPKAVYGSYAAWFRAAERAFGDLEPWQKGMKVHSKRAATQDKQLSRAMKSLGNPSAVAFRRGAKLLQSSYLGTGYDALRQSLESMLEHPPRGVKAKEVTELRELLASRATADAAGCKAANQRTKEVAEAFRTEHAAALEAGR